MESTKILIDKSKVDSEALDKKEKKLVYFRRWLLWIPLLLCASLLYIYDFKGEMHYNIPLPHSYVSVSDKPFSKIHSGFLVDSTGCRIPDLDPFDPVVIKFIKKEKDLMCSQKHPLLVDSNHTSLFIVQSALPAFNISDVDQLDCCYQPFWRYKGPKNMDDNKITYAENCTSFRNETEVEEEFVKVTCSVEGQAIYKNFHAFVHLKPEVEERCEEARKNESSQIEERLSVLVVGIDAVSRLNFHRQMPKMDNLLRKLDAIELLGYNKVADNTFPNLVPMLSGFSEAGLRNVCWPNTNTVFDQCGWLWKNFSDAGYRTAFGEDAAWMGLFSYLKKGFKIQPTDYYIRPFMKTAEDAIGHKKELNAKLCTGSEITTAVLLNYVSKFAIKMASKDTFGFFWTASLTHDFLNYPSLGDEMFENFINNLIDTGSLNNTLLILMSDHGIRWGGIRGTYQGRLEERLPFVFFVFPQWFKDRYPEAIANLRRNTRRLTTPFDMHETLSDIVYLQRLEKEMIRKRSKLLDISEEKPKSISLFLPVHTSRTCSEAEIDPHWCTCQKSKPLSVKDFIVKNMSFILVKHLNSLLKPYGVCSQLDLAEIKSASVEFPLEDLSNKTSDKGLMDYVLVIQTTPGDALFEATVRHHLGNSSVQVTGVVSRINTYGSQSACVSDYHMKLYCYCKSYIRTSSDNN